MRLAETFQISQAWQIQPHAHATDSAGTRSPTSESAQCAWSCDSRYILVAKCGLVQVFDLADKGWEASIQTGAEGLAKAVWAPDGRCILCFSEWGVGHFLSLSLLDFTYSSAQLRVTIWSLVTGKSTYIQYPKYCGRGESRCKILPWFGVLIKVSPKLPDAQSLGYAFSEDSRYFVLAERHKSRDTVGIYDAKDDYKLLRVCLSSYQRLERKVTHFTAFPIAIDFPGVTCAFAYSAIPGTLGGTNRGELCSPIQQK